ncbi:MAG: sensor histidine kinase N-terminal domain-containing protein [Beijerinckiaceae bacterium]|nr:sensor histidine kinase N-terminal domain-containing protein [Beijerinckiaceae bacterium]
MNSLRARLLLILIASTSAIWLCGFAWIYVDARQETQHLLDRRLMEAARMVLSLSAPGTLANDPNLPVVVSAGGPIAGASYEHILTCQVWSFDGRLVGRSGNAPASKLTEQPVGFSERVVDGEIYRVYAAEDPVKRVRVLVGDNLEQRQRFVRDLVRSLLIPAAFILPMLAILIWISVKQGLEPLQHATRSLSARDAENLTPLDVGRSPSEIRPLINALNGLFGKVVAAREHERSFVAYAAHEMRTPLAGLKTQVQIAAQATVPEMRTNALCQALKGVDRTSRLVQQLLAMSRLDASPPRLQDQWINLAAAFRDVTAHMSRDLLPERVTIAASVRNHSVAIDREMFDLAARNLVENALQLTPPDGTVRLSVTQEGHEAKICIEDDGPGIPSGEEELVLQRFFRGRHKSASGSGLGLAIVTTALDRAGAKLRLCSPGGGHGLRAEIIVSSNRVRLDDAA